MNPITTIPKQISVVANCVIAAPAASQMPSFGLEIVIPAPAGMTGILVKHTQSKL